MSLLQRWRLRLGALIDAGPVDAEDVRRPVLIGAIAIVLFFGVFGLWAALAPLQGAVVAQGLVKVDGNRKSVQHLDGGIVRNLSVREGDRVAAGASLILLDDTQARAEVDILRQQFAVLRVTEARLMAELERAEIIRFPDDVAVHEQDPYVRSLMQGQTRQLETRRVTLEGQRQIIRQRIAQIEEQIIGMRGVEAALRAQIVSIGQEIASLRQLVDRGLIARPRLLQLERMVQALGGQVSDNVASRARAEQSIGEQQQQILQIENERLTEVTRDLKDIQARLLDIVPRLHNARAVLARTQVRAPYAGQVVGLSVFGSGAVVGAGERILDIVPEQSALVVEAQIAVEAIDEVRPGQRAEVYFTSFKLRSTPRIRAEVMTISADRLTDARSGAAYFNALVEVSRDDLSSAPDIVLYPGMPVTVMIPTVQRTALDYLIGPLTRSVHQGFRER